MQYQIEEELFQFSNGREWVVYAPLKRIAFRANGSLVNLLCDIRERVAVHPESCAEAMAKLQECGIVRVATEEPTPPRKTRDSLHAPFQPLNLTLFLTSDCNLACRYCYGDGGDHRASMPAVIGLAAIDRLFQTANQKGATKVHLGFHGGGEPTLRMETMKKFVGYARRLARKEKIELTLGLTTNGVMPEGAARWVAKNIDQVNVSLDGPGEIQDLQRPTKRGGGSSEVVARTLRALEKLKTPYHLRGTVTRFAEERMPEIAAYLCNFSPASIQLEPMFSSRRAAKTEMEEPDELSFVRGFLAAAEIARKAGIRLHFSGDRFPAISSRFCSIGWETFAVTPEGRATACFEVLRNDDPRSSVFFFGGFESGKGFSFQQDRIVNLRVLSETEFAHCRDCLARFHCAGDCRAKGLYPDAKAADMHGTSRCRIIQALTKARLVGLLESVPLVRLDDAGDTPKEC